MKKTTFGRSLELVKLAASVGIRELTSGSMTSRIAQAKAIVESLNQLKGAALKAGQLLSIDAGEYFPPEAVEILQALQNQAQPARAEEVLSVLQNDLGAEKLAQLQPISSQPIAAASIGQVHKARLQNQSVAIKIQYPGVRESVDSDLRLLKGICQSFCSLTGRKVDLGPFFNEVRDVLSQETDYRNEANNQTRYAELLQETLPGQDIYLVPTPFFDYSSARVLTMSWAEGESVNAWIAKRPDQIKRETLARYLLDLFCMEFFSWGFVQTDPNYGNYLVQDKPDHLKLVLLDFGATRKYPSEFRRQYVEVLNTIASGNKKEIINKAIEFNLISSEESAESKELLIEMLRLSLQPFFSNKNRQSKFNFSDPEYARQTRRVIQDFVKSLKFSPPPYHILFLHRKLGGVFNFLKRLEVEINLTPYWERMTQ